MSRDQRPTFLEGLERVPGGSSHTEPEEVRLHLLVGVALLNE